MLATTHYKKPGLFTQHVFNPTVAFLTRRGLSVWGSRVLEVPGRTSGELRRVPVNLLVHDGGQYLVSPRGHGQWVRNVRANDGRLDLLLGRQRTRYVATEVADAEKVEVLRAYVTRWSSRSDSSSAGSVRTRPTTSSLPSLRTTRCSASMRLLEPTARPAGSRRSPRLHEIVEAATAVLDADGAEALTMRRLADDLGMRAPSLYKHVRDKAVLEAALIEDAMFDLGDALHAALAEPGRQGVVASVLRTYRARSLAVPHRYRLATSGRLRRDLLPECLEEWAGQPFYFAADGDEHRSQALWSLAHGMVILEIDGRYPDGSDLDRTWGAAATAFGSPAEGASGP